MNKLAMDVFNVNKNTRLNNKVLPHVERKELWNVLGVQRVYPIRHKR